MKPGRKKKKGLLDRLGDKFNALKDKMSHKEGEDKKETDEGKENKEVDEGKENKEEKSDNKSNSFG